jgi:hypothetical protein
MATGISCHFPAIFKNALRGLVPLTFVVALQGNSPFLIYAKEKNADVERRSTCR